MFLAKMAEFGYEVEEILGHRFSPSFEVEYCVTWKGTEERTWLSGTDIAGSEVYTSYMETFNNGKKTEAAKENANGEKKKKMGPKSKTMN